MPWTWPTGFCASHPVKAHGTGGRRVRTNVGDCWDHFVCTFTYPGDVPVSFCSKQAGAGIEDICVKVFAENGPLESHYGGPTNIRGQRESYAGGSSPGIYRAGAVTNIRLFLDAIRSGRPINNAQETQQHHHLHLGPHGRLWPYYRHLGRSDPRQPTLGRPFESSCRRATMAAGLTAR